MARRTRTRHLIELGGLVQKAGLVEIADDDRAMLYGAFLDLATRMQGEDGEQIRLLMRRRGARQFAEEAEASAAARAVSVVSAIRARENGPAARNSAGPKQRARSRPGRARRSPGGA